MGLNTWGLVLYNNLEVLLLFLIELFVVGKGALMKTTQHIILASLSGLLVARALALGSKRLLFASYLERRDGVFLG